jgi:hypothetical protein
MYPWGNNPSYSLHRRLGGLQSPYVHFREKKTLRIPFF